MAIALNNETPPVAGGSMLRRIQASVPSLAPAEQRVAKLVIQDPAAFSNLSIRELSERAFVSQPTIVRFCRSLGYSGFNDFRMKLGGVMEDGIPLVHPGVSAEDKVGDVVVKVIDATLAAMQKFRTEVDGYAVARAVGVIAAAFKSQKTVLILGAGISGLVAQDAQMKLRRLGVNAITHSDSILQVVEASRLLPNDVVCVFSNSGRTRDILEVTDIAKKRGAVAIAIVSSRSPLSALADIHLAADHSEGYGQFNPMASRLVQLTMVDILATSLAVQIESAEVSAQLTEIQRNLSNRRFS